MNYNKLLKLEYVIGYLQVWASLAAAWYTSSWKKIACHHRSSLSYFLHFHKSISICLHLHQNSCISWKHDFQQTNWQAPFIIYEQIQLHNYGLSFQNFFHYWIIWYSIDFWNLPSGLVKTLSMPQLHLHNLSVTHSHSFSLDHDHLLYKG